MRHGTGTRVLLQKYCVKLGGCLRMHPPHSVLQMTGRVVLTVVLLLSSAGGDHGQGRLAVPADRRALLVHRQPLH